MENFIGIYENCISSNECSRIINWFEENTHRHKDGQSGGVVNKKDKDSTDISLDFKAGIFVSDIIFPALDKCFMQYAEEFRIGELVSTCYNIERYNVQRYFPNQGFFGEHCESSARESMDRILAWTLYLNTVTDGGGTRYTLLNEDIDAVEGRMVIFPAYWTHAHHGIVSPTQTKYIATGWFGFL